MKRQDRILTARDKFEIVTDKKQYIYIYIHFLFFYFGLSPNLTIAKSGQGVISVFENATITIHYII